MAQELFIHAGAHRTGSSSFQLMLAQNRARLRAAGVLPVYPGRDGAPGGRLRLRLPGPGAGVHRGRVLTRKLHHELARHLGHENAPARVVLSEENIAGSMIHFYAGQFYPGARRRLRLLGDGLAARGIDRPSAVLIVIRPYADLFTSAYRKRAEANPVPPFSRIAPAMAAVERGWPDLVSEIAEELAPDRLDVVPCAARGRSTGLLRQLLGREIDGLEEPRTRINTSATDEELRARQFRFQASERPNGAARHADVTEYAGTAGQGAFAVFAPDQKARLDARFEADCATLAAMPGVTFMA